MTAEALDAEGGFVFPATAFAVVRGLGLCEAAFEGGVGGRVGEEPPLLVSESDAEEVSGQASQDTSSSLSSSSAIGI